MNKKDRDFFKDIYTFFSRNCDMEDTNTDWQKTAKEMSIVLSEYNNDFCHEMCVVIYKELERRAKNGNNGRKK